MRRIADFVVEHSKMLLILFLVLTVICAACSRMVTTNTDMTKYLPDDSAMKQGMDIMEEEFTSGNTDTSIRVMFKGLSEEEKTDMAELLEEVKYVDSVSYDADSEDYNKDEYTKYVVTTGYEYGTEEESHVEKTLNSEFNHHDMVMAVDDTAAKQIPKAALALAFGILVVILITMSESWIEPLLFVITIAMAIVINLGTNLFLGTVSSTTSSIGPILQLVLSMDYSIILMNRYHQELARTTDKKKAMKKAWVNAFTSIFSSSLTTVVGLLALVFMSFKIGRDLGIVLAKGVLISVVCVLVILPGLILMFTSIILRTKKKVPVIPTGKLAGFTYRFGKVLTTGFVILFVVAYFLQQRTDLIYNMQSSDEISDIFPKTEKTVVLYENKDEGIIADYAEKVEESSYVKGITGYSETFAKECTVDELVEKFEDAGSDTDFSPEVIDILYYQYFNEGKVMPETVSDFIYFLADDVVKEDTFSEKLSEDTIENIQNLKKYADAGKLTKGMTVKKISDFMDIDEEQCEKIFLYYSIQKKKKTTERLSVPVFIDYIVNQLANDEQYKSLFSADKISSIREVQKYTNVSEMTRKINYQDMADTLGLDQSTARMVYANYFSSQKNFSAGKMTVPELMKFLQKDVLKNDTFADKLGKNAATQINVLSKFTEKKKVTKPMTASQLSKLFGIEEKVVSQIMQLDTSSQTGKKMTPLYFSDFVLKNVMNQKQYAAQFDVNTKNKLKLVNKVMNATVTGKQYSASQAAELLGMDKTSMELLFSYHKMEDGKNKVSVHKMVNYLVGNGSSSLGKDSVSKLKKLQKIINASVSGNRYGYADMASVVGMEKEQIRKLYLIYESENSTGSRRKLSVQDFVGFLSEELKDNEELAENLEQDSVDTIDSAKVLVDAVISGKKYSPEGLYKIIRDFNSDMDKSTLQLLYLYHDSKFYGNPEWKLSLNQLVNYIVDELYEDDTFSELLEEDTKNSIKEVQEQLEDATELLQGKHYSRMLLDMNGMDEMENIEDFYNTIHTEFDKTLQGKYYLIGDSAMSYEMSHRFDKELIFITLLTAVAIFLVVAISFRNFVLPLVLVLLVQCGVYITVTIIGFRGSGLYYLTLLMVECILMGSTIDYGILFSTYYRESRKKVNKKKSLISAYRGAIHTIMTSGSILVIVTGVLSQYFPDPSTAQICQNISIGALCASLLILFILPGILVTVDRFIVRKEGCVEKNRLSRKDKNK